MIQKLTFDEVKKFSSAPGVKVIAVENFLLTVHHNTSVMFAKQNLVMDAKLYKWNSATVDAIKKGIEYVEQKSYTEVV